MIVCVLIMDMVILEMLIVYIFLGYYMVVGVFIFWDVCEMFFREKVVVLVFWISEVFIVSILEENWLCRIIL